jgi:hypothetical protein
VQEDGGEGLAESGGSLPWATVAAALNSEDVGTDGRALALGGYRPIDLSVSCPAGSIVAPLG